MASKSVKKKSEDVGSLAGSVNMGDETQVGGDRVVQTGGGAYIGGNVSTGGGAFVGRDQIMSLGAGVEGTAKLFQTLYATVDNRPNTRPEDKDDLRAEVRELEQYARDRGDYADESVVARHMRIIGRMAPDILDVILATVGNPVSGFLTVAKKTAEKAKELVGKQAST